MSRRAFDEMLSENSFVEFWGRLSKMGGDGVEGSVKIENEDIIGEDGVDSGASKVDMKSLAKNIDIQEMEKVLKASICYVPPHQRFLKLSRTISGSSCSTTYQRKENNG